MGKGSLDFKPFKIGKYLLLERLAMGGMAEVYRAKASGAGGFEKQLAIKRILPNYSQNDEFRRMFEYEARLSSMLTHSNIVQVYDFVKSGDTYLLALEYIDGKNLRQFLNKAKKIKFYVPIEFGTFIINEVCKGLEYAHKKKDDLTGRPLNIIHRDMSPQNVMFSYEGSVKIVDFGIAKAKDRVDETRSGVIKGKFGYMSPEQANGEPIDHRTDIFSTSIILYELLTAKRLFFSENDMATLKLIQECMIPPPSRSNPKITAELEKIILKGLTRDPNLRYQSAGEMHRVLQEYLNKYYPKLNQKDLSDAVQLVFKDEILQEKKRFEEIHRQSIPFSQGGANRKGEMGELEEEIEGSITRSEVEQDTDVTYVGDEESEGDLNLRDPDSVRDTQIPSGGDSDAESTLRAAENGESTLANPTDASTDKTRLEPIVLDEEPDSTVGNTTPAPPPKKSQGVGEPSLKKRGSDDSVSLRSLNEKREESTSGVHLEKSNTKATRRRESSLNYIKEINNDQIKKETLPSVPPPPKRTTNPSFVPKSLGNATPPTKEKYKPIEIMMEEPQKNNTPKEKWETEDFTWTEERTSTSIIKKMKGLFTVLILGSSVLGVGLLYRSYLNGNSLKIASKVFSLLGIEQSTETPYQERKRSKLERELSASTPTQSVRGKPSAEAECSLLVESDPSGAIVMIGGQEKGLTPLTHFVECKKAFDLTIKKEGFEAVSENLMARDRSSRLFRSLKKSVTGNLQFTLDQNATIEIKELGYSQYVQANETVTIPVKANRKIKVTFINEIFGIDKSEEFIVPEGNIVSKAIKLLPNK